jgi:hypothetical protein
VLTNILNAKEYGPVPAEPVYTIRLEVAEISIAMGLILS